MTGHPGASTTWWGQKCITSSVAAEEKRSSETMRGAESSHQGQSYRRGLSNPRQRDHFFNNLHGASYFGKIDLSDAYYQIELDEDAKEICTINRSQGLFKMCRLPQGLKNSSIFQNCIESTLKRINSVVIFQDDVRVYGTTNEPYEKQMLAVKSRLREKNFNINEKKSNSKPVSSVSFLGYSVSKEGIAPDPKHVEKIKIAKPPSNLKQLESFVGLENFYGRMIPDFATKIFP